MVLGERDESWNGELLLRVRAFAGTCAVIDELITSVRCIVQVEGGLVRCNNRDGSHFWPGGRREAGETFEETAIREVAEETGWVLDRPSLRLLGWLHFEHLTRRPVDWPYPHPDFCQVVFTAMATRRARTDDGRAWTDTEGWEIDSDVVALGAGAFDEITAPFVSLLAHRS